MAIIKTTDNRERLHSRLHCIWRVNLSDRSKTLVKQKLVDCLTHKGNVEEPRFVTVTRQGTNPVDDRILADIRSESGAFIGLATIEDNGVGWLHFTTR